MEDIKQAVSFLKLILGLIIGFLRTLIGFLGRQGRVASLVAYVIISYALELKARRLGVKNTYRRGFLHFFLAFAFSRTLSFTLLKV